MLVLERLAGEEIVLRTENGDEIAMVRVVETSHDRVKIGIDAGDEIKIIRVELLDEDGNDN